MTSAPAWLSRLPVGSSARIRAGSVTIARATATRCCWPPDSSVGSWSRRSPRPSRSSAALARGLALRARDALVEQRRRDVVERGRPRQQVVRLEDEADGPAADCGQAVVVERRRRACRRACTARPSAGPGSRGCSSSCSCPSRTARRSRRTRRACTCEADVVEGGHLDVAHLVGPADPIEIDDRLGHRSVPVRVAGVAVAAGTVPPSRMIGPPPGTAKPPVGFVAAFCALAVPVTTASPSVEAALDLGRGVRDQADVDRRWPAACPSAPRTSTL